VNPPESIITTMNQIAQSSPRRRLIPYEPALITRGYSLREYEAQLERRFRESKGEKSKLQFIFGRSLNDILKVDLKPIEKNENENESNQSLVKVQMEDVKDKLLTTKPIRWKWQEIWQTRESEGFMPRCYMCNSYFDPFIDELQNEKIKPNKTSTYSSVHFTQEQTHEEAQGGLSICLQCRELNDENKFKEVDLSNSIALVTGARIKIGYSIALSLVRNGAIVILTTRFPSVAAKNFLNEPDSSKWFHRLHIYGIDFRHLGSVSTFIQHVLRYYPHLDILINNAAQSIRRPPAYYRELIKEEQILQSSTSDLAIKIKNIVKDFENDPWKFSRSDLEKVLTSSPTTTTISSSSSSTSTSSTLVSTPSKFSSPIFSNEISTSTNFGDIPLSTALTQIPLLPSDVLKDDQNFPPNSKDESGQQLDLRPQTSWNMEPNEIHMIEIVEVQLINSTVPLMLASQFLPLLEKRKQKQSQREDQSKMVHSFIINVTSQEGQFSAQNKSNEHVHTNMAKAGLNMLTRTIAYDYSQKGIYVSSVDTGWVSRMRPLVSTTLSIKPPLLIEDGAARVLHPIYSTFDSEKEPIFGVLLKNFEVVPW